MALEDSVLRLIERGPLIYDALRAKLGAVPDDLDRAIERLLRARLIFRDKGRFTTNANGDTSMATTSTTNEPSGELQLPATKVCTKCDKKKPRDAFSKRRAAKDGLQQWCKKCTTEVTAAIAPRNGTQKRGRPVVRATKPAPAAASPTPAASGASPAHVAILHFHDGVRIGALTPSASGLAQMSYHVDLSAEQLDELCAWWAASKRHAGAAGKAP